MTGHSLYSLAARRVACPGSRALESNYPKDKDSPYALEGEAAHWLAHKLLGGCFGEGELLPISAPNGEFLTLEMWDGAQIYADHILEIARKLGGDLHIEERIDITTIHPKCWGTPDCWLFNAWATTYMGL